MGCSPQGLQLMGQAWGHKDALTWRLLAKTVPSTSSEGEVGGRGAAHWAGSGPDIGLLRVQGSEGLRGGEAETEA